MSFPVCQIVMHLEVMSMHALIKRFNVCTQAKFQAYISSFMVNIHDFGFFKVVFIQSYVCMHVQTFNARKHSIIRRSNQGLLCLKNEFGDQAYLYIHVFQEKQDTFRCQWLLLQFQLFHHFQVIKAMKTHHFELKEVRKLIVSIYTLLFL